MTKTTDKIVKQLVDEKIKLINESFKINDKIDELKKKIIKLPVELRIEYAQAEQLAFTEHSKKIKKSK